MEKSCSLSASVAAIIILELTFLISPAAEVTIPSDVSALQDLFKNLNYPPQLVGWKSDGGDPCGESWLGISCDAASVVNIILPRLGLRGYIAGQVNLPNLKELVLSFNEIQGEIPYFLPLNITYIDLSSNKFHSNIPRSFAILKQLHHLNLSHNILYGTIGNYFSDLQNLQRMDLSYNSFSGDLPSSFGNLSSLTGLFLQNNQLSGSVIPLANLPLTDLNIQNNNFSGFVLNQIQRVPNLWIWGNKFHCGADSPPWESVLQTLAAEQRTFSLWIIVGSIVVAIHIIVSVVLIICLIRNNQSDRPNSDFHIRRNNGSMRSILLEIRRKYPLYLSLVVIFFTAFVCVPRWILLLALSAVAVLFGWKGFKGIQEVRERNAFKVVDSDLLLGMRSSEEQGISERQAWVFTISSILLTSLVMVLVVNFAACDP